MVKKLKVVLSGLIFMGRDMFLGFSLGIFLTVILSKINPEIDRVVGLLIPASILAGMLKGLFKFIFLNINNTAIKGYIENYPKYKILMFWLLLTTGALMYSYGLNIYFWFSRPLALLEGNVVLGNLKPWLWNVTFVLVTLAGAVSHLLDPPLKEH